MIQPGACEASIARFASWRTLSLVVHTAIACPMANPSVCTAALFALISSLRARVARRLDAAIGVVCCFEAGRDGFWLHRLLTAHGIANYVLEPTSILINRRARRAKTDRLDAIGMLRVLAAYLRGDR